MQRRYNEIPQRWLQCPRKGDLIADTFVVFKTPLDSRYNDQIPEECRFDVEMLFASLKTRHIKLGLIIDLTNTDRFYKKDAVEQHECKYVKLACKGHGETPSPEYTSKFIDMCETFIRQNPLHAIGVHCTHGFNRSGFLVISYLIEKLQWSLDAALTTFARKRAPGIYKQDYLHELCVRYADVDEETMAPPLPDWCTESDDRDDDGNQINGVNGSADGDDGTNGAAADGDSSARHGGKEFNRGSGIFMDGLVRGNISTVTGPRLKKLQSDVQQFCKWKKSGFPGAQPVSMTCDNLQFLSKMPYKVSWKADGTRYMMLIEREGQVFMVDRDNGFFHLPDLVFPRRKEPDTHVYDTLLDGEMIFDQVDGKKVPRYLIYDIIKFEGQDVGQADFDRRLLCIDKEIIKPRSDKMLAGTLDRTTQPFSIRIKPFWDLTTTNTQNILEGKFSQEVSHKTDGLIFQSKYWKYTGGRCDEMLKWKPADMNSMDFKLMIIRERKEGMLPETKGCLHVGGLDPPFSYLKVTKDLHQYNNKIIECTFDFPSQQWKFMRERTDKSFPNSHTTALGVCESIRRPVTKQILYEYIAKSRWRPPVTDMRPPATNMRPPVTVAGTHSPDNSKTSSKTRCYDQDEMAPPPSAKVPRLS